MVRPEFPGSSCLTPGPPSPLGFHLCRPVRHFDLYSSVPPRNTCSLGPKWRCMFRDFLQRKRQVYSRHLLLPLCQSQGHIFLFQCKALPHKTEARKRERLSDLPTDTSPLTDPWTNLPLVSSSPIHSPVQQLPADSEHQENR